MAITIDGSANTIAGLAVGGLPDGTVDNGTMADNAINSAEIAAGAVDLAHLSSTGTAGSGNFLRGDNTWQAAGLGKVVQIVQGQTNTQYTTTSSDFQDTDCTVAITTNSAASKILILGNPFVGIRSENGVDAYGRIELLRDTTQIRVGFYGHWMGNTSGLTTNHYHSPSFTHLDAGVSTGTAYTYKIKYCLTSSSAQAQFNPHSGHGGSHITAIEILT